MEHNRTYYILGALIIVVGLVFVFSYKYEKKTETTTPAITLGTIGNLQKGSAPWPAEFTHLRQRLASIGLPALSEEGTVLHIHQHLDIMIHGQTAAVPAGIGIDPNDQFISPIHVHDTSGIIHVESPTVQTFTLGQFFDIWGLTFTADCIGGNCSDGTNTLHVFVNGKKYDGDPRALALAAHQEIFIFYGTTAELPKVIPSTFTFPAGY